MIPLEESSRTEPPAAGGGSPGVDSPTDTDGVELVEPLSALLERLFAVEAGRDQTLNQLLLGLESRGPLALIIFLNLPFLTPMAVPGLSIIFGIVILYLSGRMLLGYPAALPAVLGNWRVKGRVLVAVVRAGTKGLRWLERGIHPRPSVWVASTVSRRFNAALICWCAFLLALPLPPTIPCSNLIPGVAIILVAMSMAEEDGATIWWAYASVFGATTYLGLMIWLQAAILLGLMHRIAHFLHLGA